jgi:hypothetical protein
MSYHHLDFHNKTEWYRGEMAYAKQQRMIKEAKRAGMKIRPIVQVRPLAAAALAAATQALIRISSLFTSWRCQLRSRFGTAPATETLVSQPKP